MLKIAYCSNVHAGASLQLTRQNLATYARQVKQHFSPQEDMGVGLWLSEQTASEMVADPPAAEDFRLFLAESGIVPFTFNGFPFGDFHQEVVKHDVYQPTWFDDRRAAFTWNLVQLIHQFAPPGEASISTLPIAWGSPQPADAELARSAKLLRQLAQKMAEFEAQTGRLVYLCLEPEPGCVIQYSEDVVHYFEKFLLSGGDEAIIRRHLRVCHDVCHGVVMGESQSRMLQTYQAAGIQVGKVQISSAVVVNFDAIEVRDRPPAVQQLASFAEDRYLHQTTIESDGQTTFYDDLPLALQSVTSAEHAQGLWRIHFHVPVYLTRFGWLQASQQDIIECVANVRRYSDVQHFEVETYAWNVLPSDLRQDDLARGISDELAWFAGLADKHLTSDRAI